MRDDLFADSSAAAQRAIRHYLDKKQDQFFLQAAVSLELAGKATLADIHPALLIDKDFDSLLHVCGSSKHSKSPPWKLRTIGAHEVLRRCCQIEPRLNGDFNDLQLLAELRNSVTHVGRIPQSDALKILIAYGRAITVLCGRAKIDLGAFFGDFASVIQVHLDESAELVRRVVAEKIAQARSNFEMRYAAFDAKGREAIFAALGASHEALRHDMQNVICPACQQTGYMEGKIDCDWDVDYDSAGQPERAYQIVTLLCDSFSCKACGIELKGDELEAAGLDTVIPVEDVNASDLYDREPDWS